MEINQRHNYALDSTPKPPNLVTKGLKWLCVNSDLHQFLQLKEAEAQVSHTWFEQVPQFVVIHQPHKHTECIFLWHFLQKTEALILGVWSMECGVCEYGV